MSLCQCQARRSWEEVDIDEVKRRPGAANTCLFALRLHEEYEWARVSSTSQRRASSGHYRVSSNVGKRGWRGNEYAMPSLTRNPPIRRVPTLIVVAHVSTNRSTLPSELQPFYQSSHPSCGSKTDRDRTNTRCLVNFAFLHRY